MELVTLEEETSEIPLFPSGSPAEVMWAYSEVAAVCQPGRGLQPEPDPAGTLALDFYPPEFWENTFLFLSPTVYGILLWQLQLTIIASSIMRGSEFQGVKGEREEFSAITSCVVHAHKSKSWGSCAVTSYIFS